VSIAAYLGPPSTYQLPEDVDTDGEERQVDNKEGSQVGEIRRVDARGERLNKGEGCKVGHS